MASTADRSTNVPLRSPDTSTGHPPETRLVYREHIDLFRLEEALAFAKSAEERYNLLTLILTRELAMAANIPHPTDPDDEEQWVKDHEEVMDIAKEFRERRVPTPTFPMVQPLTGLEVPEYDIKTHGNVPVASVMAPDMPPFLEVYMRFQLHAAYEEAIGPMPGWHQRIRDILWQWKVWDLNTEVVAGLSSTTESDIDKEIGQTRQYVRSRQTTEAQRFADHEEAIDVDDGTDDSDGVGFGPDP